MEYRVQRVEDAVLAIKDSLQTLVKLEVHHGETREALARAFQQCEKLETHIGELTTRVVAIEKVLPGLCELRNWVVAGILGTLTLVGLGFWGLLLNPKHDHESHPQIIEQRQSGP